jgi:hypothetical protein
VSKDRLDIMVLPEQQCFSVRNDAAGWVDLGRIVQTGYA